MFIRRKIILILILLISGYLSVSAQTERPPLSTDRPDQTEAPTLLPQGYVQIETGFLFERDTPAALESDTYVDSYNLGTSLLRYGFSNKIELRLGAGFTIQQIKEGKIITEKSGLANVLISSKIFLADEDGIIPEGALLLNLFLPIGNKSFISDNLVPGLVLASRYTFTKWLGFSSNFGFRFFENNNQIIRYSFSLGSDIMPKIAIFIESFGRFSGNNKPAHLVDLGMTYRIIPNLQLDTSYGFALNDLAVDQFINFGASLRLPR